MRRLTLVGLEGSFFGNNQCRCNNAMKNKTVQITGSNTDIGLATARFLSADGAEVIVARRNLETSAAVKLSLVLNS